jgi:hypothetical protein
MYHNNRCRSHWTFVGGEESDLKVVNQARFHELKQSLVDTGYTNVTALQTTGSPQNVALHWLVSEDPSQIQADDEYLFHRYALVVLFFGTGGVGRTKKGSWTNQPYWLSKSGYCAWYGIVCEGNDFSDFDKNEPILSVNLTHNGLRGDLPSEIFALTTMTSLDLSDNALSGTISRELGNLDTIETIFLQKNRISSSIPSEFGAAMNSLRALDLSDNSIHGSVPDTISFASKLGYLSLAKNELTGSLPDLTRSAKIGKNFALRVRLPSFWSF